MRCVYSDDACMNDDPRDGCVIDVTCNLEDTGMMGDDGCCGC